MKSVFWNSPAIRIAGFLVPFLFLGHITAFAQSVGINDTNADPDPSAMLDVQSTSKGMLAPRMTTAQRTAIGSPAVGLLVFDTNTQSFWFRENSGWIELKKSPWLTNGDTIYTLDKWVGIGLDNPLKALHVKGGLVVQETAVGNNLGEIFMLDSVGRTRVILNKEYADTLTQFRIEVLVPDPSGTARVEFFRNTNAAVKRVEFFRGKGFGTTRSAVIGVGTENSYFQNTGGNFGIGTSTPTNLLDIDGGALENNGTTAVVRVKSGNGAQTLLLDGNEIDALASGLYLNKNTNQDIILADGGGKVGIGTISPTHLLHVNGVARSTQASWATASDRRAKTNILPISGALSLLGQLNPVTFNWKQEFAKTHPGLHKLNYGFIAQEVETVIPEMVIKTTEKIDNESVNDFRLMNNDAFVPLLVKCVQEQQALIQGQKNELTELKIQLADMQQQMQTLLGELKSIKTTLAQKEGGK